MKRLIVCSFSILFLLTGCNADDSTEEKVSAEEETYTREITDEEKGYIQLILDHEYENLEKQTANNDGEALKSDYFYLSNAFKIHEEMRDAIGELNKSKEDDTVEVSFPTPSHISSNYRTILMNLDKIKYVPKELESEVSKLTELSIEREKYYSEMSNLEKVQKDADNRTLNPQPVTIGMTDEQVLTEGWGRPQKINRTTNAYGVSEQWVYKGYKFLYFEDGVLVTIQN